MGDHIQIESAGGQFSAYRAMPPHLPAPAVVVLQELFGVNPDMRLTCDELAARGFIAICPDLFWRQQPGIDLDGRSEVDWQTGLALYQAYDRDLGLGDVATTVRAAAIIEGASGKVGVLGYCLGGLMTFLVAARTHVDAAVAFHGADTEKYLEEAPAITAPMLFHLAGEDEFMPERARLEIAAAMENHAIVQVFTYPDCHHAFSRHDGPHFNAKAALSAKNRTWTFFTAMLRGGKASTDAAQRVLQATTSQERSIGGQP